MSIEKGDMERKEPEQSDEESSNYEESVGGPKENEKRESLQAQIARYETTIKTASKAKKMSEEMNALNELGIVYYQVGRHREAVNCQERQLSLAILLRDTRSVRRALCNLGCAAKGAKNYDRALDCFQKGLEMATGERDNKAKGKFLNNLASAYESMADFDNAIKYYEMRLTLAKSMRDKLAETKSCASLGNVFHVSGNIRESIKYFEQVVVCIKLKIASDIQQTAKSQDGDSVKDLEGRSSSWGSQFSSS